MNSQDHLIGPLKPAHRMRSGSCFAAPGGLRGIPTRYPPASSSNCWSRTPLYYLAGGNHLVESFGWCGTAFLWAACAAWAACAGMASGDWRPQRPRLFCQPEEVTPPLPRESGARKVFHLYLFQKWTKWGVGLGFAEIPVGPSGTRQGARRERGSGEGGGIGGCAALIQAAQRAPLLKPSKGPASWRR